MTCIVWDGKTLACDSRCSDDFDGHRNYTRNKIRQLGKDEYVAMAGDWSDIELAFQWMKAGQKKKSKPKLESFGAIWVKDGQAQIADTKLVWVPIDHGSVGRGRTVANVALYLGLDAIRAVETACDLDQTCDRPVYHVRINK